MMKVAFLLLFLSSSGNPQYFYKGMYFHTMEDCEKSKQGQVLKMTMEAEVIGYKDIHIDARCFEVDAQSFKPSVGA